MKTLLESILQSTSTGIYKAANAIKEWFNETGNDEYWAVRNGTIVCTNPSHSFFYEIYSNDFPKEYLPFEKEFKCSFRPGPFVNMPKEYWPEKVYNMSLDMRCIENSELDLPHIILNDKIPSTVSFDDQKHSIVKTIKHISLEFTAKNTTGHWTGRMNRINLNKTSFLLSDLKNIYVTGEPFSIGLHDSELGMILDNMVKNARRRIKTQEQYVTAMEKLYEELMQYLCNCPKIYRLELSLDRRKIQYIEFDHSKKKVFIN